MNEFKKGFANTMGILAGLVVGGLISDWMLGKNKKKEASENTEHRGYATVGVVPTEKTE